LTQAEKDANDHVRQEAAAALAKIVGSDSR
jgi:hypothetical protein